MMRSLWSAATGMTAQQTNIDVISNNLANVSTVGFKGQRMDFADFVYQDSFSSAGTTQIGRGVKIGAVMQNFTTGPIEGFNNLLKVLKRASFGVKRLDRFMCRLKLIYESNFDLGELAA